MSGVSFPLHLNVRAKILLIFLVLSIVSLVVTGLVAFYIISDAGDLAIGSSTALGREAVNDSSTALMRSAEQDLMRIASDQATVTDVIFRETRAEIDVLSAQAAVLERDPPDRVTAPWYSIGGSGSPDPEASPVILARGTSVTPQSEEFRSVAGMYPLLVAMKSADPDIESIYVATGSGVMWMYPGTGSTPPDYDPRMRDWYRRAEESDKAVWSEPYVDAAGHGLIVTCSKAVRSTRYGTWVIGIDVTTDSINRNILNLTLNGAGYPVLLDSSGNVISRPGLSAGGMKWDEPFVAGNAFTSNNPALAAVASDMTAGKAGIARVRFNATESYVAYAPVSSMNWSFAVFMPVDRILGPVRATEAKLVSETARTSARIGEQTGRLLTIFAALSCLLLVVVVFLSWMLARIITRPVDALKDGASALGSGNLGYRVDLRTGDEFEDLAASFNTMASDLLTSIENLRRTTAEKERYVRELEIAKEIQDTFLPESPPDLAGTGIAAVTIPAMEIGGDFYDFIPVGEGRWGIVMADVSGKGISAALFMALSRTHLHVGGMTNADPTAAVRQANRWIYDDGRSSMFVTVFYGVLDPAGMQFSYVNAGHNPPVLVRQEGVQDLTGSRGIALGVVPDVSIAATAQDLRHGDLLVLYTDGVTEAFNDKNEAFGEERLRDFLQKNRAGPAGEILEDLVAEIRRFTGTADQSDDITLVVVKVE
jgi:sigma-B regulation protein RsbU (phosphoserine phosphatase)